jgi:UDP-GlcNAc3NAcA epimerase
MSKKILTVVGARPQFVKAAAVSRAIKKRSSELSEHIVHTGQHYDYNMSEVFFKELSIPQPNTNLHIGSGQHGAQTGEMLKMIESEITSVKPDLVLVYGDTNSTLAGALAAVKLHIPVAHVEAGLRSFNRRMPEEINRVVTDHVSELLFVPTLTAIHNLKAEGISDAKIKLVGDVMYDAILFYNSALKNDDNLLQSFNLQSGNYIFATIHRAENTDIPKRLLDIFEQLKIVAEKLKVILPLHPRTRSYIDKYGITVPQNVKIIEPLGYLATLTLQKNCLLIITDSGGVQKEAFLNGKFCITVRPETEWTELVDAGFNFLADPIERVSKLVDDLSAHQMEVSRDFEPYGSGDASDKIISSITDYLR